MRASCHCGGVVIALPRPPEWVGQCNCSICTKLGTLMAYYPTADVAVTGVTDTYIWGDRMIALHHCPTCGCMTHWTSTGEDYGRQGVNARLLEDFDLDSAEVRQFDNR